MDVEIVARFRSAHDDASRVVLEGFHAIKHAVRFGATIESLVTRDRAALEQMARDLAPDVMEHMTSAAAISPEAYARLVPRPHPTGVVAIALRPAVDPATLLTDPHPAPIVLLEDPRRPENLGAAIRAAAAAGATGLLTLGGADPWHAATVRGAAGLQFALPVARLDSFEELSGVMAPKRRNAAGVAANAAATAANAAAVADRRPLVALDPGGEPLRPGGLVPRALLAFGSERRGLSRSLLARAERRLAIPMREGVSSLNLATAVAVALYAWKWSDASQ